MRRFQEPVFEKARLQDVLGFAAAFKERGCMFVNLNATTVDGGCDVLYVFRAPGTGATGLEGRIVFVPNGEHLHSITQYFPAAFVFENEAHDLFGIPFDGLSIDYGGDFYTLSMSYPMNPSARGEADGPQEVAAEGKGEDNE